MDSGRRGSARSSSVPLHSTQYTTLAVGGQCDSGLSRRCTQRRSHCSPPLSQCYTRRLTTTQHNTVLLLDGIEMEAAKHHLLLLASHSLQRSLLSFVMLALLLVLVGTTDAVHNVSASNEQPEQLDLPAPASTFHPTVDHVLDSITRLLHVDALVHHSNQQRVAVLLSLLLVTAAILWQLYRFVLSRTSGASNAPTVLLTGPMSAGKTLLFYSLCGDNGRATHTSMQENVAVINSAADSQPTPGSDSGGRQVRLVDVPGHPSQQHKVQQYAGQAKAIIVMVRGVSGGSGSSVADIDTAAGDSGSGESERGGVVGSGGAGSSGRDEQAIHMLWQLLSSAALQQRHTRLLLLINTPGSGGSKRSGVRGDSTERWLLDGIERRRKVQEGMNGAAAASAAGAAVAAVGGLGSGGMSDTAGEAEGSAYRRVGVAGKSFEWSDSVMPVSVVECDVRVPAAQLKQLRRWLNSV